MADEQKQKQRDYKKEYRKNITNEQKQRYIKAIKIHQSKYKEKYREAKKRFRENMTDEQKQKRRDYQREYYEKYYAAKKLNNKIIDGSDNDNENNKVIDDSNKIIDNDSDKIIDDSDKKKLLMIVKMCFYVLIV